MSHLIRANPLLEDIVITVFYVGEHRCSAFICHAHVMCVRLCVLECVTAGPSSKTGAGE